MTLAPLRYWPRNGYAGESGKCKVVLAPDLGSSIRGILVAAQQGSDFFFLVPGQVPERRLGRRTVNTPGRTLSPRDLPSMTDYRVPHLVTD
jgi:hypothetical protein